MSKNKIGEDSTIPKFVYLKIRRRDGVESLTTLEFKMTIDGCIKESFRTCDNMNELLTYIASLLNKRTPDILTSDAFWTHGVQYCYLFNRVTNYSYVVKSRFQDCSFDKELGMYNLTYVWHTIRDLYFWCP